MHEPPLARQRDFRPIHISNFSRVENDFYPTPDWVTQLLLDHVPRRGPVSQAVAVLRAARHPKV